MLAYEMNQTIKVYSEMKWQVKKIVKDKRRCGW